MTDAIVRGAAAPSGSAEVVTGPKAGPVRLFGLPGAAIGPLPAGHQFLSLPGWTPGQGPSVFAIAGDGGGGTILTGMGQRQNEPAIGMIIAIINTGVGTIFTRALDATAPVGTQFSAAVSVSGGNAGLFIAGLSGGNVVWYPIAYTTT